MRREVPIWIGLLALCGALGLFLALARGSIRIAEMLRNKARSRASGIREQIKKEVPAWN